MKSVLMRNILLLGCVIFSQGAFATATTIHCKVEKTTQGDHKLDTVTCGNVDFDYPDPIKGAAPYAKGVGACPELAVSLFRAQPHLEIIGLTMGYFDPNYGGPLAFTYQNSGVLFYDQIPSKFGFEFNGKKQINANYRATCEVN